MHSAALFLRLQGMIVIMSKGCRPFLSREFCVANLVFRILWAHLLFLCLCVCVFSVGIGIGLKNVVLRLRLIEEVSYISLCILYKYGKCVFCKYSTV
jgi:hypothetical protein